MANLVFVAGRKASGKTTLLHVLVDAHLAAYSNVNFVVWDRTCEWVERPGLQVLPANMFTAEEAAQYALVNAPCTLVVDEIDLACPNHGGGLVAGTALHSIVHYGRHGDAEGHGPVALLCAARRAANVHIDIRALADVIFFFSHTEPRDIQWISALCGDDWSEGVRDLEPHDYLRYDC